MKPNTEAIWAERIEEWVQSGQSATEFAEGKPYTSGTLTWAASQLRKGARGKGKGREGGSRAKRERKIRIAEVVRRWFLGGMLIGLISPGKTFIEPMVAVFLVAIPTAFQLYVNQTVKTMPAFMYVLLSALGVLFTLIGAYIGERIQMGPPPKAAD
jgi:hypothetical protein